MLLFEHARSSNACNSSLIFTLLAVVISNRYGNSDSGYDTPATGVTQHAPTGIRVVHSLHVTLIGTSTYLLESHN